MVKKVYEVDCIEPIFPYYLWDFRAIFELYTNDIPRSFFDAEGLD